LAYYASQNRGEEESGLRKRYLIGGLIVCLAVGYMLYMSFGSSVTYYVTVSELLEQSSTENEQGIRVSGKIVEDSVDWNPEKIELKFAIADEGSRLPVLYEGVIPDAFTAGKDIVVEGKYNSEGIFHANNILLKCPSKYASQE